MNFKKTALGIEFGSTRIKAVLIDENQSPVASGGYEWENKLEDGIWTYSMEDVHKGAQECFASLRNDVKEQFGVELSEVGSIGISGMMHGYLPFDKDGRQLAKFRTWRNTVTGEAAEKLTEGDIDILVCTTIIETGVDVPNVNTLIIENADRMGLAQLHQLRGRVGRSSRRASAYCTFTRDKQLSETAERRLSAIREFTQFGSGFKIAMRDLEIRGAGNLLGAQQHGHMEAVGYDMYIQLLSEAVAMQQQGEENYQPKRDCQVDISINAHIPDDYITSYPQRIAVYKRIADIHSKEDSMDVTDELIDRYGDPPESVLGLIKVALLRNTAADNGIYEITQRANMLLLFVNEIDKQVLARLAVLKGRVMASASQKPYFSVRLKNGQNAIDCLVEIIEALTAPAA